MRRVRYRGDFCPSLEAALVHELEERDPLSPALVLCPTSLLRAHLVQVCAERTDGVVNVRFVTLGGYRNEIAAAELDRRGLAPAPTGAGQLAIARLAREGALDGTDLARIAGSPGFASAAFQTVRDLREVGISAQALRAEARRRRAPAPRWSAMAGLLDGVEAIHRRAGWADEADVWACAASSVTAADRLVCLYGFYDLSARQWELVRALCAHDRDVVAMVPDGNAEAFAFTAPFHQALDGLAFVDASAPAGVDPVSPTLGLLRERLFRGAPPRARDGQPVRAEDDALRILATPGEGREAREVARAALDAVRELGVPLREIAVLLRTDDAIEPFLEAFDAAGMPTLSRGPRASLDPGLRALCLLGGVRASGFGRAALAELLTAEVLDPEVLVPSTLRAGFRPSGWDGLTRRLGIVRGAGDFRRKLLGHGRHLAARAARGEATRPEEAMRLAALTAAIDVLDEAVRRIPERGTLATFADALAGCRPLLRPGGGGLFLETLDALRALDPAAGEVTLDDVLKLLDDRGAQATAGKGRFGDGCVTVRELMSARGVPFDVVLLPHLSERMFPRPVRGDPLLDDGERRELTRATGKSLPLKARAIEEERTLFRLAVGAARRRLVLSYPRLDPARGTERAPSLYVFVALEAARGVHVGESDLASDPCLERISLSRLHPASPDRLLDGRERLLHEVHQATSADDAGRAVRALAGYPHARAAVRLEAARFGERTLTAYDGLLLSAEARAYAARALQADALSASRLERYAFCPFQFLLAHVLGLEKPEEPELQYALDPLDRGNLVHRILERFVRARIGAAPEPAEDARARLRQIASEEFAREEQEGTTGYPFLWHAERRSIEANLELWLAREEGMSAGLATTDVELAFGPGSRVPIVTLDAGDRPIRFAGRIDRVDVAVDGERGLVIDYKTGRPKRGLEDDSLYGGQSLQLAVYILAARAAHPQVQRWTAVFDHVSREHGFARIAYDEGPGGERLGALARAALHVVEGVQAGLFLQEPTSCTYCDFKSACASPAVVAHRKCEDPLRAPFVALREIP